MSNDQSATKLAKWNKLLADALAASRIKPSTASERVELVSSLRGLFCPECGDEQPERGCQCNNDE